jgi:hypothetical protein
LQWLETGSNGGLGTERTVALEEGAEEKEGEDKKEKEEEKNDDDDKRQHWVLSTRVVSGINVRYTA